MNNAQWIGKSLFLNRIKIAAISTEWGHDNGRATALCHLPGGAVVLGHFSSTEEAKSIAMQSANSRIKAMFGASINTTAQAVSEGRGLRVIARRIWAAGKWSCDRPCDEAGLFHQLGKTLAIPEGAAPTPMSISGGTTGPDAEPEFNPIED